jgi:response regulator RpfG family c-di-GMP phosphodiesterase
MNQKVLFVDDDPNILSGYRRLLRNRYELVTAPGGREGLERIEQEGPFSVVISDMRMPQMDGIQFLQAVQEKSPDTVRLMLTGNADQQTAINAVNDGNVFRFMNKPCDDALMIRMIDDAIEQHRLTTAEKELLHGTLDGSIKLLMHILSLAAPDFYSVDQALREQAVSLLKRLGAGNAWEMEMATQLSHISYITLPPETLDKLDTHRPMSDAEQEIVMQLPQTAHDLLSNIPRLENVAKIILYQDKCYDGSGFPEDSLAGDEIPLESRVLKVLHDMKMQVDKNNIKTGQALDILQTRKGVYDPRILQLAAEIFRDDHKKRKLSEPFDVAIHDLRPGQVLVSSVETEDGRLMFTAGNQLSQTIIRRLLNFDSVHRIKQPITVAVPI